MKSVEHIKALGVALTSVIITIIISFPMVAFYAHVIEPGHPKEFYTQAAQWIAPWSSYIFGPIIFFLFNFWLVKNSSKRFAITFPMTTIVYYLIIEVSILTVMNADIQEVLLNMKGVFWVSVKLIGALLGSYLGRKRQTTKN